MKKQIAILATIVAASALSAFGQDWTVVYTSGNGLVWDDFTKGAGVGETAGAGDLNIEALWAPAGTADLLGAGTTTNGQTSVTTTQAAEITTMLSSGWTLAQNFSSGSGTAALGTVETTSGGVTGGKGGSIVAYNGGNPFEISTTSTGATGSTIELILIAFNGSASSYSTAADLGWSSLINEPIGLTATDPNAADQETQEGYIPFGAAQVVGAPEPATLALAALGGLSMLGLRRRKA